MTRTVHEYRFDRFRLVLNERRLLDDGKQVKLGARAYDALVMLVQERDRAVSKAELLERVWPGLIVEENNLQVQVATLRKVLGQHAIATIPGHGYQFSLPLKEAAGVTAVTSPSPKHNLPQPLTSFIGREHELAELAQLLNATRLLTLTGIGGSGKTRLAIELAKAVLSSFPEVCFVDLAPVAEPERVALCVAGAFGVREESDKPIEETLIRNVAERNLLLVLDNCEHLLDACAQLVMRLLPVAAGLRVLVTSREGLGVAGERVMPVRSLSMPAPGSDDARALGESESARLFIERAQEVAPEFVLDAGNSAAVADICRRLDGIPLALELAAARMRLLSVEQIRSKLNDRFRLLTGTVRALPRHQTLIATLQWSYEHLNAEEQRWLRRLSVFAGGWTLDAAAAVAAESDDEAETLQRLERLVDQSLVLVDRSAGDEARYAMLETLRQYAHDRLTESGEGELLRERHLRYFAGLAQRAHANFFIRDAGRWFKRLDRELSNVLAAHAWCAGGGASAALGLDLASSTRVYWIYRGLFALGHKVYAEALGREDADRRSTQYARVLFGLGQHYNFAGRFAEGLGPLSEALAIARERGDETLMSYCLDKIGFARAFVGDPAAGLASVEEEIALCTRRGDSVTLGSALITKAAIHRMATDFDAAAAALQQALTVDVGGDIEHLHIIHVDLARVRIAGGSLERAHASLVEALRLLGEMDSPYRTTVALDVASLLAAARGDFTRAARLQGTCETSLDRMGGLRNPYDDAVVTQLRERVRAELRAESYATACDAGRTISTNEALRETIAWLEQTQAPAR
jgi:non-specific serine/threonine protein kinase